MSKELPLDKIRIDGNTQPRVKLDNATVAEYAEQMAAGVEFPDAVVFHDGTDHWLSAGFHRYFASKKAELLTINCDVRKGTLQDARDFATSSNTDHGLKRTNEDKRKQVGMTLEDHPDWADRKIAEHCCVGHPLVADVRSQLEEIPVETTSKRTGKDGKKRTVTQQPTPAQGVTTPSDESKPKPQSDESPELKDLNKLLDLLGKAVRQADDINRDLFPSPHHANVISALDTACKSATLWKQGAKKR